MPDLEIAPHAFLRVALVESPVAVGPSGPELVALLGAGARPPVPFCDPTAIVPSVRDAIRTMLRRTGYRPAGRGKPASEFLRGVLEREGAVRSICNVVDVNNVVSLHSCLPISVLDRDHLGPFLRLAPGAAGDSYVFNPSGQSIDLAGLLTVSSRASPADPWVPAGNPVKDSMTTKVGPGTTGILAILYAHRDLPGGYLESAAGWFAELLTAHCQALEPRVRIVDPPAPAG